MQLILLLLWRNPGRFGGLKMAEDNPVRIDVNKFPDNLRKTVLDMDEDSYRIFPELNIHIQKYKRGFASGFPGQQLINIGWEPAWLYKESYEQRRQKEKARLVSERLHTDYEETLAILEEVQPTRADSYYNDPPEEDQKAVENWMESHFNVVTSWRAGGNGLSISFVIKP
jgi:hypothetical protein